MGIQARDRLDQGVEVAQVVVTLLEGAVVLDETEPEVVRSSFAEADGGLAQEAAEGKYRCSWRSSLRRRAS